MLRAASPLRARPSLRIDLLEDRAVPADVSAPAILQWFEGSYDSIERRAVDVFHAGYGTVYTPPPGRADQGNFSVGYDVYDRFELGQPGRPTLYGTETGLKSAIDAVHRLGGSYVVDFVLNHAGFSDLGTPGFAAAGGYPGLAITLPNDIDGDFHSGFASGDIEGRLAGLVDIAQEKNHVLIRHPVGPNAQNVPAGTTPAFGRLANIPTPTNAQFYPDRDLQPIMLFDPATNESNIPVYPYNLTNPMAGDATPENALGFLMRNAQWLVQTVGVDGLRIDAAKHFPTWVMNFVDRAVYRSNPRPLLNGGTNHVFSFSEIFDGSKPFLQNFIRKDINPNDPGRIGGNRDVLDFPQFFALQANLTGNGFANDWRNIVNASQDSNDDGLANNGSQGVSFVSSHDTFGPYLSNVAYAYTLMRPGNAVVYFNGKEFGNGRDFPKDGRGDALGGLYGNGLTTLVNLRDTHGRGNYIERWLEKEMLIYERQASALVVLSNRVDGGFDSRTVQTSFAPGTRLVELTGNASDPIVDPFNDFPEVLEVNGDGTVNLRVPRNMAPNGVQHDRGYFIYGVSGPQGSLTLTNVSGTLAGQTPTAETNGSARLSSIDVISSDTFQVQLSTLPVNLLGSIRDRAADGDNALLRIDSGHDANGNSVVDYTSPGNPAYGFENFQTVHSPGYFNTGGDGQYAQVIDATRLGEGTHFITARAFRHREPGEGEAVYSDFKRAVYVDRLPAVSAVDRFDPIVAGINENRRVVVRSVDKTADNVHVFLDLPASMTDSQIVSMVGAGSQANKIDRDLWTKDFAGLSHGNHVITVVTFEITGRASVQRFAGQFVSTIFGAGLGDLDTDGDRDPTDAAIFQLVVGSGDSQFNPAADFDGDGRVGAIDLLRFREQARTQGALATLSAIDLYFGPIASNLAIDEGGPFGLRVNLPLAAPSMGFEWDVDNDGQFDDAVGSIGAVDWTSLTNLGIRDNGVFSIKMRASVGGDSTVFTRQLVVANVAPTANFAPAGPVGESARATLAFTLATDPSPRDQSVGFRYSFDFNNDGDFTDPGDVRESRTPTARFRFATEGTYTVRGRIRDKDGGVRDLFSNVSVLNDDRISIGSRVGLPGTATSIDAVSGAIRFTVRPFGTTYRGGVQVATGDVNGDGLPDLVAAMATGARPFVVAFDGQSGQELRRFEPFAGTTLNGLNVAVGDVDGDGTGDMVVGSGVGGPGAIRIFSGVTGRMIASVGSDAQRRAVRVAAGDVDGDGRADVVMAPATGPAVVRVFSGRNRSILSSFTSFNGYSGGVSLAVGDVDGDGQSEIAVSQTASPSARLALYTGRGAFLRERSPFVGLATTQMNLAMSDGDGDGRSDLFVVAAERPGVIRRIKGSTFDPLLDISTLIPTGPIG